MILLKNFKIFISQKPLDSSESEESYSPLAPAGGGLLSAAIGVTRAVTQFLGAALQVWIN